MTDLANQTLRLGQLVAWLISNRQAEGSPAGLLDDIREVAAALASLIAAVPVEGRQAVLNIVLTELPQDVAAFVVSQATPTGSA